MTPVYLALALVAGAALTVGLSLNAALGGALRNPFVAGTCSFVVGAIALTAVSASLETWPTVAALGRAPWWAWTGGLLGGVYLVANIVLIPRIGALNTIGLAVAGQMLASITIDGFGLMGLEASHLNAFDYLGSLLAVAGAGLIMEIHTQLQRLATPDALLFALAIAIGMAVPVQAAANAEMRQFADAAIFAGVVSFGGGSVVLLGLLAVLRMVKGAPLVTRQAIAATPWWAWAGGLFAATYVDLTLTLVPLIGEAAAIGFAIAGQQMLSVVVDQYGLLGLPKRPVSGTRAVGVATLLAGVGLIQAF